jgi:hypothetical protein
MGGFSTKIHLSVAELTSEIADLLAAHQEPLAEPSGAPLGPLQKERGGAQGNPESVATQGAHSELL